MGLRDGVVELAGLGIRDMIKTPCRKKGGNVAPRTGSFYPLLASLLPHYCPTTKALYLRIPMPLGHYLILILAGFLAGGLNALAGGGGFITLPTLMFTGATPILSNTSSTLALWPGMITALFAYRSRLSSRSHPLKLYAAMSVVGGTLGAVLLLKTSNHFFMALLPWLLLAATLLFSFGNRITEWAVGKRPGEGSALPKGVSYTLLFLIAVYGGYFGGGMGIMTLAVLAVIGMRDIHEMNAIKTLWTLMINGIALAIFLGTGKIDWTRGLTMMVGCTAGGYTAAYFAQQIPRIWVRRFIILVASGMTFYYLLNSYFLHSRV